MTCQYLPSLKPVTLLTGLMGIKTAAHVKLVLQAHCAAVHTLQTTAPG